jgi:hypothetical protein
MKLSISLMTIIPLFAVTSLVMVGCGNSKKSAPVGIPKPASEQAQIETFLKTFDKSTYSYDRTNPANQQFAGRIEGSTAVVERVAAGEGKFNYKATVSVLIKGETTELVGTAVLVPSEILTRLQVQMVDPQTMQPVQGAAKSPDKYSIEADCAGTCNNLIVRIFELADGDQSKAPKAQTVVVFVRPDAAAIKENIRLKKQAVAAAAAEKLKSANAASASASTDKVAKAAADKAAADKAVADQAATDKLAADAAAAPAAADSPTSNMVDGPVTYVIRWSASPTAEFAGGMKVSAEQALAAHPRLPVASATQTPAAAPGAQTPANPASAAPAAPTTTAPVTPSVNDGGNPAAAIPGSLDAVPQAATGPTNPEEFLQAQIARQRGEAQAAPQGQSLQMVPEGGTTEQAVAPIVR